MRLYAIIGDIYYLLEEYLLAADSFYNALNCHVEQQNAFVHLRLGESLYELEDRPKALDHLLRAYMLEGKEIFEEEKGAYFEFLKNNVKGIRVDEPSLPDDPHVA